MVTAAKPESRPPVLTTPHAKFGRYGWIAQHQCPSWRPGLRRFGVLDHPPHPPREFCLVGKEICIN
jgi:hypothetical protein